MEIVFNIELLSIKFLAKGIQMLAGERGVGTLERR
jgi:hypothetical protein